MEEIPVVTPAPATTEQSGLAPVEASEAPTPARDELATQRARLRELMPRINETRIDVSRAKQEPSPQELQDQEAQQQETSVEKPSLWTRFWKFVGFGEE
ncbi:hypothetical protein EON80_32010 [bacterium]|nr:MAG: hypothetical protein EON80_32010 [bacterium]